MIFKQILHISSIFVKISHLYNAIIHHLKQMSTHNNYHFLANASTNKEVVDKKIRDLNLIPFCHN